MAEDNEKLEKRRAANRASYERNKEARLERSRQWRAANPDKMKQYNKDWHARHPGYSTARSKRWVAANPEKAKELLRKWYLDNREATVGRTRQKTTGCTPEQYAALLEQQQGLCAICRKPPMKVALAADHCHVIGIVRGLLCFNCNTAIGLLGDDVNRVAAALAYLQLPHPAAEGHNLGEGA